MNVGNTTPPRPTAVAGAFYPADAGELTRLLESSFTGPRGPGELPPRHRTAERHIRAAIVPHAGYIYSGPIAAHAFRALSAERPATSILLLGVNHHGVGSRAALSAVAWETPLGILPVDTLLVDALSTGPLRVDERAHALEHSIEVQLPFLQYVEPHPRFAALSISFASYASLREIAMVVRNALRGRDVLLLASTDFSHYVPPGEAERRDREAIAPILVRDARGLYDVVTERQISMCGIAPTTVLLAALEEEPLTCRLLKWGHSGESEPMRQVVGYASLVLESRAALGSPTAPVEPRR